MTKWQLDFGNKKGFVKKATSNHHLWQDKWDYPIRFKCQSMHTQNTHAYQYTPTYYN